MHSERIPFSPLFVHPRGAYSHLNQRLVAGKLGDFATEVNLGGEGRDDHFHRQLPNRLVKTLALMFAQV